MNGHHKKYYREGAAMLVQFKTVTGPFNDSVGKHLYCNTNIHTEYFTFKITDKENPLWPILYVVDTEKNIIGENLRERKACVNPKEHIGSWFLHGHALAIVKMQATATSVQQSNLISL